METIVGGTGSGPVVDRDGKALRALNQFDTGAARDGQPSAGPGTDGAGGTATRHRTGWTGRRWTRLAGGAVVPLVLLAVWQGVTASGMVPAFQLPGPVAV
jgi:sulfonate transport system permease protein